MFRHKCCALRSSKHVGGALVAAPHASSPASATGGSYLWHVCMHIKGLPLHRLLWPKCQMPNVWCESPLNVRALQARMINELHCKVINNRGHEIMAY